MVHLSHELVDFVLCAQDVWLLLVILLWLLRFGLSLSTSLGLLLLFSHTLLLLQLKSLVPTPRFLLDFLRSLCPLLLEEEVDYCGAHR